MKRTAPEPRPLQVSCALCERLHVPREATASNPVCADCIGQQLPCARYPLRRPAQPRRR